MTAVATLLELTEVTKRYSSPDGANPVPVLNNLSLVIARGASLAVVGPSGSGKSTLLQIIGTLDRPNSGRVLLDGIDLNQLDDLQLAAVRNRQIGFVFQSHFLLPQCTVLENVLVPTLAKVGQAFSMSSLSNDKSASKVGTPSVAPEAAEARAVRLLKRVGLAERMNHRPGQLSGGERQRVAVVRALINRPELLLADEPTGSLDHVSATALGQLLVDLNREEGVTLILVTHALDLAKQMGRVMELRNGSLENVL